MLSVLWVPRYGDNINRVVNTIGDIFAKSALDTFGKIYINNKRRHNNDKPWYNKECKIKRKTSLWKGKLLDLRLVETFFENIKAIRSYDQFNTTT
jgi:hypothetical protein